MQMFLIKDISLERSLIRSEADQFISNYTQCKDSEVSKLKEDYEKSIKNMKVLVKVCFELKLSRIFYYYTVIIYVYYILYMYNYICFLLYM